MVACGVTEKIREVGGEEGFATEDRNTCATAVKEACGGLKQKALVDGKSRFSDSIFKASTEIHVLPPGGLVGRIEATESLPHGAAHQPCRGGRLWYDDRGPRG